jgi:hypothetical protein
MNRQQWILGYNGYNHKPQVMSVANLPDYENSSRYPRISIRSISINPVDYKILQGEQRLFMNNTFPKVFGTDFFGMFESGPSSTPKPVIGMTNPLVYGSCRTYIDPKRATYVGIQSSNIEVCSLPAAGLTALYTLSRQEYNVLKSLVHNKFQQASSPCEQKNVLIVGANGGVGSYAVQIYKHLGYRILVSCSKQWHPWMKDLGADYVYDRGEIPSDTTCDKIIDCPGILTPDQVRLLSITKRKKRTIYIPISIPNDSIFRRLRESITQTMNYKTKILLAVPKKTSLCILARLYEQHHIKLCPISLLPINQGDKAIQIAQAGGFLGKIGILLDNKRSEE